jgi:hypothetical protein
MKNKAILICLICFFTCALHAQVTIGSGIEPVKGALLDLKEKTPANPAVDNTTATRGLLLSRVLLSRVNMLYPMFEDKNSPGQPASNYDETPERDAENAAHTGLWVYNLTDNGIFCPGVYVWLGDVWKRLQEPCCPYIETKPADVTFCGSGKPSLTAKASTGAVIRWYDAATGGTLLKTGTSETDTYIPGTDITANTSIWIDAYNPSAGSACTMLREEIRVTINPSPVITLPAQATQTICAGDNATFTVTSSQTPVNIVWYREGGAAQGTTGATLTTGTAGKYYAVATNTATGCVSNNSGMVEVVVNPKPVITLPAQATQTICAGDNATFTVTSSQTPVNIVWYREGGAAQGTTGATLTTGTAGKYYAVATNTATGCVSNKSGMVEVVVNPKPVITLPAQATQTICEGNNATFTVTASQTPVNIVWYREGGAAQGTTGATLTTATAGKYYAVATNTATGCISNNSGMVEVVVNPLPAIITGLGDEVCPGETASISVTAGTGAKVRWYTALTGGTQITTGITENGTTSSYAPPTTTAGEYTYYAEAYNEATGCVSDKRHAVKLIVNARPKTPATGNSNITVCYNTAATLTASLDSNDTGCVIEWYDAANNKVGQGTTFETPALLTNTKYYAESRNISTNCTSTTRLEINVTVNIVTATVERTMKVNASGNLEIIYRVAGNPTDVIEWYDTPELTTLIGTGSELVRTAQPTVQNLYVRKTSGGCVSDIAHVAVPTCPTHGLQMNATITAEWAAEDYWLNLTVRGTGMPQSFQGLQQTVKVLSVEYEDATNTFVVEYKIQVAYENEKGAYIQTPQQDILYSCCGVIFTRLTIWPNRGPAADYPWKKCWRIDTTCYDSGFGVVKSTNIAETGITTHVP